MATLQVQKPMPLCPQGLHIFTLVEVKPSYSEKFQTDQLMWRFVSDKMSPEGTLYEVAIWTGLKYGHIKAKLTWLLDMLQPGITPAQAENLNTDVFLHRQYEGMVKHAVKEGGGDPYATFLYLRPLQTAQSAAVSPNADFVDPFAFDRDGAVQLCAECEQELTEAEIKASDKRWHGELYLCAAHGKIKVQAEKAEKPAAGAPVAA